MRTEDGARWAPVPGFGGKYEVSDGGEVRCKPHAAVRRDGKPQNFKSRTLKVRISGRYPTVTLNWMQRSTPVRLHRLIAEAFLPNPEGHPLVRHLNDDPTDFRLANLAWGSSLDNIRDCIRNGGHVQASRTECPQGHQYSEANTHLDRYGRRSCRACRREADQRRKPKPVVQEESK